MTATKLRRRVGSVIGAAGLVLLLAACTPSGYKAEQSSTAMVHHLITGEPNNPGAVSCGEFNIDDGQFKGFCTIYGVTYEVHSRYNNGSEPNNSANIHVFRWTGIGGHCFAIKSTGWPPYCQLH